MNGSNPHKESSHSCPPTTTEKTVIPNSTTQANQHHKSFQLNDRPLKADQSVKPVQCPYRCKYCQDQGREVYHWHNQCPIKANLGQSSGNRPPYQRQNYNNTSQASDSTTVATPAQEAPQEGAGMLIPCQTQGTLACDPQPTSINPLIDIDVKLDSTPIKAFVDTGSTISIASDSTFRQLNKQISPNTAIQLKQISGQTKTIGRFTAQLQIADKVRTVGFHVISDFQYPLLIGLDIGREFGLQLDLNTSKVSISPDLTDNEYSSPNTATVEIKSPATLTAPKTPAISTAPKPTAPEISNIPPLATKPVQLQKLLHSKPLKSRANKKSFQSPKSRSLSGTNTEERSGHSKSRHDSNFLVNSLRNDDQHKHSNTTGKYHPNIHLNSIFAPFSQSNSILFSPNKILKSGEM